MEGEYCTKHRRLSVTQPENTPNNNLSSSTMASRSAQSSYDPYHLSSDNDNYFMPNKVAEMTPGCSDRAGRSLTALRLYLNSPPRFQRKWGQINPNLNDYHSDPLQSCSTFRLPDITNWWRQQDETCSKYPNLSNVAWDIFSIIPHSVGVEASYYLGRDLIGWRQSRTTRKALYEKVVVRQGA
jgi:hypothetical protein